jgi:predicted nucleic acid-binding protein
MPEHVVLPFMRWVAGGGTEVNEVPGTAARDLTDMMVRYADRPMDLADASLVWLAAKTGISDILTLDNADFGIYRLPNGKRLRNLLRTS